MTHPIVAAIQLSSTENVDENLVTAARLIKEAKSKNAALVVLPEMFALITKDKKITIDAQKIQQFLSDEARKNKLWIVGGTIPLQSDTHAKHHAATLIYDDTGKCVGRYDKINLFDVVISEAESYRESDAYQPGEKTLVIDTPIGKLGIAICYDIRFPAIFHTLLAQGAEIFAIPAAFTVKTGKAHWELLARARAVENFCYFVGACQTGTHTSGRQTYGHSLIVDPWGEVKAVLPQNAGVITSEVDLSFLKQTRKNFGRN